MSALNHFLKNIVTAFAVIVWFSLPAAAVEQARLDRLFQQLKQVEEAEAIKIAAEITLEMSKSGSPAMDLLLKRGKDALEAGDTQAAIEHLTALTDHAPNFAEGWHARATAFFQAGKLGPALADLEQTLALNPRHFGALYGLAVIFEQLNRNEEAYDAYSEVLAIHPHHEDVAKALERLEPLVNGVNL